MASDQGQEKTEQPTQRRIDKAAEEGQVAQSADFSAGLLILLGAIFFLVAGTWFYRRLTSKLAADLSSENLLANVRDIEHKSSQIINQTLWELFWLLAPLVGLTFVLVFANGVLMNGFKMTWKPLSPNFEKLNPVNGFKKLFSSRAVVRGLIAVVKVAVMSAIVYWLIVAALNRIAVSSGMELSAIVSIGWSLTMQIALSIAASMVIVGLADLLFQKWKHIQDLKMTRKEIRDEHKDTEGDPLLRARMRKLQREIATRTMLGDVKDATVVVTNPTHLAIALRFDRSKDDAPIVLAKGADAMAKKIIEIAKENKVPVVERKPVARALYGIVEVGDEIPMELYQAIAEILAFVMKQRSIVA